MAKKYFIGTSGWNYRHWKGRFYPEEITQKNWFNFYSKRFSTVEVNYSFYRWPPAKTFRKWFQESPSNFEFTMKAPRLITHLKRLKEVKRPVNDFYKLTSLLKHKAGCHLFQLPPSLKRNQETFERLSRFVKVLDKRKRNVIEFRHNSWWDQEVYDLLREHQVSFCTVSGLGMPDDIVNTSQIAYLRFHGKRYNTNYPPKSLARYAKIMKGLKCKRVYAYFNNDFQAFAPRNALQLMENLK